MAIFTCSIIVGNEIISLNWMNFELFYVLESIRNILQDLRRLKNIPSQSQQVKVKESTTQGSMANMLSCHA